MSKPREYWWSYAKAMIRAYPDLKQQYDDLHRQKITADLSGMSGGGGTASRITENIATKELPVCKQKEYDSVSRAIAITRMMPNGKERLGIVNLVLWKQTHTIEGASTQLHISQAQAWRFHRDFIRLVGKCYGLAD